MRKIIINDQIVADSEICHGKPIFAGTRIMVWQVLELLANGETLEKITHAFPSLSSKHIKAALNYASSLTRENYVIVPIQPALSAWRKRPDRTFMKLLTETKSFAGRLIVLHPGEYKILGLGQNLEEIWLSTKIYEKAANLDNSGKRE